MATTVDNYKVKVTVEGKEGLKNLKRDMEDIGMVGGPLQNTINGIIGKLGPMGLAASAAAAAFVALGSKALALAGELSDIAGATGIAAGTLMNFRQSVVEAGGKAEDFAQIAAKLNQSVQEANGGNEKFQQSFRDLGVFVTDANGKLRPTEEILRDIIARFQSGELSSKQYAAAIDILGKNINKLELAKLQAVADPVKDAQIKQLDKYNDAIDRLTEKINNGLIVAFGKLAQAINEAFDTGDKWKKLEEEANKRGQTYRAQTEGFMNKPLFGKEKDPLSGELVVLPNRLRDMTEKEKAAYKQRQEAAAAHANEMQRQLNRSQSGTTQQQGGFGQTPESVLNARKASEKRILESRIEQERQGQLAINSERLSAILMFADQEDAITQKTEATIKDIKINSQAEIAKARLDIYAQEKLTEQEKAKEFAAKRKEIELKAETDIQKARTQMSEQLKREAERIESIITQSKARVVEEEKLNELLQKRNDFINANSTLTDKERERAQQLFDIEEERLKVLRQISLIKDLPPEERLRRENEINAIYDKRKILTQDQQAADRALQENFSKGFEKAYRQYVEDSRNYFEQAGKMFRLITQQMEDSIVNFAKTGKFEFKSFLNTILEELLRSQIRQLLAATFSIGGSKGSLLSGTSSLLGGILGFANGGVIPTNNPVIVGEKGPELLVGAAGNRVIPNHDLGGTTVVNYNISAVDALSFKQLLARDPTFIHAVAMQGGKGQPLRR